MATYINTVTGDYPRYIGDIQLEHPNHKEGDVLPGDWAEVTETDPPAVSENQYAKLTNPELVNDKYIMKWEIITLTAEEIEQQKVNTIKYKLAIANLTASEIQYIADNSDLF